VRTVLLTPITCTNTHLQSFCLTLTDIKGKLGKEKNEHVTVTFECNRSLETTCRFQVRKYARELHESDILNNGLSVDTPRTRFGTQQMVATQLLSNPTRALFCLKRIFRKKQRKTNANKREQLECDIYVGRGLTRQNHGQDRVQGRGAKWGQFHTGKSSRSLASLFPQSLSISRLLAL